MMGAIKGVVKQQGIRRGLFAGYGSFMLRDLPFDVIEFVACVPPNPSHGGRVESGLHGRWKPPTQPPLCATAARELTDADGVGGVREREREREGGPGGLTREGNAAFKPADAMQFEYHYLC
jgi:hypothetical protein